MGEKDFNRKECIRALQKLGFHLGNKRRGRHDKFYPPKDIEGRITGLQPRFIMVPRHTELHCQSEILSELRKMGGEALASNFLEKI